MSLGSQTSDAAPELILEQARTIAETARVPSADFTEHLRSSSALVKALPPAALLAQLTPMLCARDVDVALQWLYDVGALDAFLPELAASVGFSQEAGRKHKDVWEHTKQVVRQSVPRPIVRWAALLHDIGKMKTRGYTPDGKVHFHGHAEVGARMFRDVGRRFGFESDARRQIHFLILHHLRANQYQASWTDSAVRRFARDMGEFLPDLLDLSRADITSKRPGRRQEALSSIHALSERIIKLAEEDAKQPPLPKGLGTLLMAELKLPPSRQIGDLKQACEEAVAGGTLEPHQDARYYLDWLLRTGRVVI